MMWLEAVSGTIIEGPERKQKSRSVITNDGARFAAVGQLGDPGGPHVLNRYVPAGALVGVQDLVDFLLQSVQFMFDLRLIPAANLLQHSLPLLQDPFHFMRLFIREIQFVPQLVRDAARHFFRMMDAMDNSLPNGDQRDPRADHAPG